MNTFARIGSRVIVAVGAVIGLGNAVSVMAGNAVFQSYPLNLYNNMLDGQWQGNTVASDGNVYFGSSSHAYNTSAMFFKYDPRSTQLTVLSDGISDWCGESMPVHIPQGKLHSPICESNGWLYFSTHLGDYDQTLVGGVSAIDRHYPGSHLLGYNLATGEHRDFGVTHPHFSDYSAIVVDAQGKYIYNMASPFSTADIANYGTRLYRTEIATGIKTDLGMAPGAGNGRGTEYYMFADQRNDVWFTLGRGYEGTGGGNDSLFKISGATGAITAYPQALPQMKNYSSNTLAPAAKQNNTFWCWGESLGDGNRFLFTENDGPNTSDFGGSVYIFDSSKIDSDPAAAFSEVAWIGATELGLALVDDRLYFTQRSDNRPEQGLSATNVANGVTIHLKCLDLDTPGQIVDYGAIYDQDGRTLLRGQSLSSDGQYVYVVGDFMMLPTDDHSIEAYKQSGWPPTESFYWTGRGQMFATFEVPEPATALLLFLAAATLLARYRRQCGRASGRQDV
jgi:hypothetical protein